MIYEEYLSQLMVLEAGMLLASAWCLVRALYRFISRWKGEGRQCVWKRMGRAGRCVEEKTEGAALLPRFGGNQLRPVKTALIPFDNLIPP